MIFISFKYGCSYEQDGNGDLLMRFIGTMQNQESGLLSPFRLYENYIFSVSGAANIFKKINTININIIYMKY